MLVTVNRTTFTQTIIFSLVHSLRARSSSRVASEALCEKTHKRAAKYFHACVRLLTITPE